MGLVPGAAKEALGDSLSPPEADLETAMNSLSPLVEEIAVGKDFIETDAHE